MNESSKTEGSNSSKEHECPHCASTFTERVAAFPFCSERCRLLDLGAWAREDYVIAGGQPASTDELEEA